MKYCAQCGKSVSALFCSHCGAKAEGGADTQNKENKTDDTQESGWAAIAPNAESPTASFSPKWWIRGGAALFFAFIAYLNLPISWKTFGPNQTGTQQPSVPAKTLGAASGDPALEIWVNAAKDAVAQYEMVKRSGSPGDICLQASIVSASFLQAKDEASYAKWKRTEILDCGRAGMGDQAAYLKALAEDMKENGEKSEFAQQVKGLVGTPSSSTVQAQQLPISAHSWDAKITGASGIGGDTAKITASVTGEDLREYCARDLGEYDDKTNSYGDGGSPETKAKIDSCVTKESHEHLNQQHFAQANCTTKTITATSALRGSFQITGRDNSGAFQWKAVQTGETLDGSTASGASLLSAQFDLLCP